MHRRGTLGNNHVTSATASKDNSFTIDDDSENADGASDKDVDGDMELKEEVVEPNAAEPETEIV